MTRNRSKANKFKRNALAGFVVAATVLAIILGGISMRETKNHPAHFLTVSGNYERISATLQSKLGVEELQINGTAVDMSGAEKISAPYRLSSSLYSGDGSVQDLVWTVSAARKEMTVLVDGLKPRDKVSLVLDGNSVFTDIPADWSGRLELVSDLVSEKDIKACIEISGGGSMICHQVPKAAGA